MENIDFSVFYIRKVAVSFFFFFFSFPHQKLQTNDSFLSNAFQLVIH